MNDYNIETVYRDGAVAASYTYDVFEQRIAKTATDNFGNVTDVHYHHEREGRLIGETSAVTHAFLF
ncbi:hypothetical protein [Litorimonas taeanensis]|uniref:hypothetical protein n=1 Tax=Litorimonas taeanensis TaxID=568099 RepID=UPI000EB500B3|nr:hypothetical protein [Litorimonas taeanensis]